MLSSAPMTTAAHWWEVIPFALMLVVIAVAPLVGFSQRHWDRTGIQLCVSLLLGLPVAAWFAAQGNGGVVARTMLEYGQFIWLLGTLFVVTGGIAIVGTLAATPRANVLVLAVGSVLASVIGTTGAAMLLIRPLLRANEHRRHRAHTVVFTIFIVANGGGLLTPIGDPPLFIGMLRGVPFDWTFGLAPVWLVVNGMLLASYYGLDRRAWRLEAPRPRPETMDADPLRIRGSINLLYLVGIIAAIAFAPSIDPDRIAAGDAGISAWIPWREIAMGLGMYLSLRTGNRRTRYSHNHFQWSPILQVGAIFLGVFLTMAPALRYLASVAPRLPLNEITFFVFTGGLSSVLDNAPTYVTFFEIARGLPGQPRIAGVPEHYLVAISAGAVICGALTYIGNGPNYMVKAIAETHAVAMPSFGGYIALAVRYVFPAITAVALIFLTHVWWATAAGWFLVLVIVTVTVAESRLPRSSIAG